MYVREREGTIDMLHIILVFLVSYVIKLMTYESASET